MAAAEAGVRRKAWLPEKAEHNHRRRLLGTREQAVHFTEISRFDAGHQDSLRWTIRKLGRGVYRGAEARSVGEAVESNQPAPSK